MVLTRAQTKAAAMAQTGVASGDIPHLTTFTCFRLLPFDMRALIWKVICFEPRNVDINFRIRGGITDQQPVGRPLHEMVLENVLYSYFSQCRPPPALHVSKELRAEALKWYKLEFGREVVDRGYTITFPPKIYINFKVDRLCWMNWGAIAYSIPPQPLSVSGCVWSRDQISEFFKLCKGQKLRRLALNACMSSKFLHRDLESLVLQIGFLDEITFMFENFYVGPPWKGNVLELQEFTETSFMWMGPVANQHPENIRAFDEKWMEVSTAVNFERTPDVSYMELKWSSKTQPEVAEPDDGVYPHR